MPYASHWSSLNSGLDSFGDQGFLCHPWNGFVDMHHASIDYFKKEVTFTRSLGPIVVLKDVRRTLPLCLISSLKVGKLVSNGYPIFLAHVVDTRVGKLAIEKVQVVDEFPNVFLEELLSFPPYREMEFAIDLIPSMTLISIPPYRKAPAKLRELKN